MCVCACSEMMAGAFAREFQVSGPFAAHDRQRPCISVEQRITHTLCVRVCRVLSVRVRCLMLSVRQLHTHAYLLAQAQHVGMYV